MQYIISNALHCVPVLQQKHFGKYVISFDLRKNLMRLIEDAQDDRIKGISVEITCLPGVPGKLTPQGLTLGRRSLISRTVVQEAPAMLERHISVRPARGQQPKRVT